MMDLRSERSIVLLIFAVQLVNLLDFVMVVPMGPDFAKALDIPASELGKVVGSYTAGAAVSSLVGSTFLDRFDRRSALGMAMIGLVVGTMLGGFAHGLTSLVAARILAGAFAGPATSISLSIITDTIPIERRGRAMGMVLSAHSVAAVAGVPASLWVSEHAGWRWPFFGLAAVGACLSLGSVAALPKLRAHLAPGVKTPVLSIRSFMRRADVLSAYAMTMVAFSSVFMVIPNIPAYVQQNLGYPRERLHFLYLAGGLVGLASNRIGGRLADRFGTERVGVAGTALLVGVLYAGFIASPPILPVLAIYAGVLLGLGVRNVAHNTLISRVPATHERARFMSMNVAVQHAGFALGAFLSAQMLHELPDKQLANVPEVALVAVALCVVHPALALSLESRLRRRPATRAA